MALITAALGFSSGKSDAKSPVLGLTEQGVNLQCQRYHDGFEGLVSPSAEDARDFNKDGQNDTYISCADGTTYALFTGSENSGYRAVNYVFYYGI